MPTVDFTLADVEKIVQKIVSQSIDARFKVFEEKYENNMLAIRQNFRSLIGRLDKITNISTDVQGA